jgi:competence protein ComEC
MAEPSKSRGRAATWRPWAPPSATAVPRPASAWPDRAADLAGRATSRLRAWLAAETGAGMLVPWLAIGFGCGILIYFNTDREPALWATIALFAATVLAAVLCRHRPVGFPLAIGAAVIAAGLTNATLKGALIAHPVLAKPVWNADVAGYVEIREERERSDRITLRVERISADRLNEKLERIRIAVRKGTAPPVGSFVELKARLSPPLEPLRPGGYDFARDMYFQRIGASGFALGRIRTAQSPELPTLGLRYRAVVDGIRETIDKRIRAVLPGDRGSIASALITGKRDPISPQVNDAMYVSGLGHVLSISGYHMAVVAGVVFFAIRALFALLPAFANRHAIKKWAALVALFVAGLYLLLSGAEVATQRSFIMIGIVLIGVLVDRQTLTYRTITVAAFGVLILAPEAVVHPSFQMSFAATLALVAGYQHGLPWMIREGKTQLAARIALWGGREVVSLAIASLLAGTATIPFVAYHFHRVSPYGVVANLAAMPIVSGWVMPWGILGLLAMPLGLDAYCWQLMGHGIDWMTAVSLWTATFPGASGRVAGFGAGPLLLCTLGLVILCLLKTPLRLIGAVLICWAVTMMVRSPKPDLLIAPDGTAIAVRTDDGHLAMINLGTDTFAFREWLAADGDERSPRDVALGNGLSCDEAGCIAKLRDGSLVAFVKRAEAVEEDCRRASFVVSGREIPGDCAARVIGPKDWRTSGAMAVRRLNGRFEIEPARSAGYDRPWARKLSDSTPVSGSGESINRPPPDSTPNREDLEPGD